MGSQRVGQDFWLNKKRLKASVFWINNLRYNVKTQAGLLTIWRLMIWQLTTVIRIVIGAPFFYLSLLFHNVSFTSWSLACISHHKLTMTSLFPKRSPPVEETRVFYKHLQQGSFTVLLWQVYMPGFPDFLASFDFSNYTSVSWGCSITFTLWELSFLSFSSKCVRC